MQDKARENMLNCQLSTNGIVDPNVLEIMEQTPRELFLPDQFHSIAYCDEDLLLEGSSFLMDPLVFAKMLQSALIQQDDIVLNLGDTTGYSSAVLSALVTTVVALENKIGILDRARKIWAEMDLCNIAVLKGDNCEGCVEHAPYTLIFINGSIPEIPEILKQQLSIGGRLICVLREQNRHIGKITIVKKLDENSYSSVTLDDAATPYLDEFLPESEFIF